MGLYRTRRRDVFGDRDCRIRQGVPAELTLLSLKNKTKSQETRELSERGYLYFVNRGYLRLEHLGVQK